ncbi:replication factor C subunit 2/4 [Nematocida minor]|uniref:replication factor C subunit 2/4 n=1 Tax=Nematocida minor TaxID=1912983 RepID=UPI00221FE9EC|nr:replication factor C subunit 2/4 [Nematocida minor]KAI5190094.1 replication factor C subunit 2/4 [Nematocida minor]
MSLSNSTWTEKYRPSSLESMALPAEIRDFFSSLLSGRHALPNIILHGPPGSGKTTLALILANSLSRKESILELNASSDREISAIRGKIKTFAAAKSHSGEVKIIIMDECDYLTTDAQHCLRRIIEDTHKNTRFVFITNYINKVIDPIKSRLVPLHIPWTGSSESVNILSRIKEKEKLNITREDIEYILEITEGDMRRSLVLLQTVGACKVAPGEHRNIIAEIAGIVPNDILKSVISVQTVPEIVELSNKISREGYSALDVVQGLSKYLVQMEPITKPMQRLFVTLANCEEEIMCGGNDTVYLSRIIASAANILHPQGIN